MASVFVATVLLGACARARFVRVFIRGREIDRRFSEAVTGLSGLHLALELVGRQEVRVVLLGVGVAAGLGPGEVGVRGGLCGRGAVVEIAGDDEVGCGGVET